MTQNDSRIHKSRFEIEIDITGPLLTQSVDARHFSEDQLGLVVDERPALPGTLVKGVLREALEELAQVAPPEMKLATKIEAWFGPETKMVAEDQMDDETGSTKDGSWDPMRGKLNFSGFWLAAKSDLKRCNLTRIEIDEGTGTVKPGALVVMRSPIEPGQMATFKGNIETWLPPDEVKLASEWIKKVSALVRAIGSATSAGLGTVDRIMISSVETSHSEETVDQACLEFGLSLNLDRPFCFAKPHGRSNVLESEGFVPGGAIIGAVAEALGCQPSGTFEELRRNLHAIRVSHAHASPVDARISQRSTPVPLSVALVGNQIMDFSNDKPELPHAPVFSSDWKPSHKKRVAEILGVHKAPPRVSIVRNRIDRDTGAAAESALFAMDAIDPAGFQWRANVSVDPDLIQDGTNPGLVMAQFQQVLRLGVVGLGKTKARATIDIREEPWPRQYKPQVLPDLQPGNRVRLLLVTSADLLGPVEKLRGTGGEKMLGKLYQQYFDEAFGDDRLVLDDWFTRESLAGGRYVYKRFWASTDMPYRPHIMTEAGSVFVFTVGKSLCAEALDELKKDFADFEKFGLPPGPTLTDAGKRDRKAHWQFHPWLATQGYSECIVNPEFPREVDTEVEHAA